MVRNKVKIAPKGPVAKDTCRHYWIVESPNGPTSRGLCTFCNAAKEFENCGPDSWWQDDISMLFELPSLPGIGPDRKWGDS